MVRFDFTSQPYNALGKLPQSCILLKREKDTRHNGACVITGTVLETKLMQLLQFRSYVQTSAQAEYQCKIQLFLAAEPLDFMVMSILGSMQNTNGGHQFYL